ncbi:Fic family protein [Solemya elarraichensis gill symbiont]|uniref:Fido domain-containing protein n=1 Tax=Solemya elarraichensis gill symbiont TaxID=1918949 RepID=A0A1T2LBG5_9GAMM|nr:Fic family protein [Solemya elarraichensis gill symbiont]OOZ42448.1 hypothetical protein BOW52_03160 [Solemya elarraichensis gill symbiont]
MYQNISYKEKLEALSGHYKTSVALAADIGVSRMTLVNWRDGPERISQKNRDKVDYLYCREIMLPSMPADWAEGEQVPLPEDVFDQPHINKKLVEQLSFGSLEIETGTQEKEFNQVIREEVVPAATQVKSVLEIANIYHTTWRTINRFRNEPDDVTSAMVRQWHVELMSGVRDDAGFYSTKIRVLPDTDLVLTDPEDIDEEIEYWAIKSRDPKDMMEIAKSHAYFELIHPFGDGNGRVGRLIMLWQCLQAGLMPPMISQYSKALYYVTLEYAQRHGHVGPLATFFNEQAKQSKDMVISGTMPKLTL